MSAAETLRANDGWSVETRPLPELSDLIKRLHYSRSSANTAVARHGLISPVGELVGAALWMPPTKNAAKTVTSDWKAVLCLSRLVVAPSVPKNGASFLLGSSLRMLDDRWRWALTYADTTEGHTGAIYRATNWTEVGAVPAGDTWVHSKTKEQRGRKRGPRNLTADQLSAAGYVRKPAAPKIKFVKSL